MLLTNTGQLAPTTPTSRETTAIALFPLFPAATVFASDNRSSYNGLMLHLQGNMRRFNLVANYTLSKAQTWGCLLGELFDYVDGVCTAQSGPNAEARTLSDPATTAPPAKTFAIALCWPVRCTFPADSN